MRPDDLQFSAEVRHPGEVLRVVQTRCGVLQRELAHLAFETGTIHGHGTFARRQHRGDLGAHGVVHPKRPELGDDGNLPRGCGDACLRTPGAARLGVQLGDPIRIAHPAV
ncbi:MAG TPA: hypothetical protein VIM30_17495 [Candidatus Limnocylindrales bacterium]